MAEWNGNTGQGSNQYSGAGYFPPVPPQRNSHGGSYDPSQGSTSWPAPAPATAPASGPASHSVPSAHGGSYDPNAPTQTSWASGQVVSSPTGIAPQNQRVSQHAGSWDPNPRSTSWPATHSTNVSPSRGFPASERAEGLASLFGTGLSTQRSSTMPVPPQPAVTRPVPHTVISAPAPHVDPGFTQANDAPGQPAHRDASVEGQDIASGPPALATDPSALPLQHSYSYSEPYQAGSYPVAPHSISYSNLHQSGPYPEASQSVSRGIDSYGQLGQASQDFSFSPAEAQGAAPVSFSTAQDAVASPTPPAKDVVQVRPEQTYSQSQYDQSYTSMASPGSANTGNTLGYGVYSQTTGNSGGLNGQYYEPQSRAYIVPPASDSSMPLDKGKTLQSPQVDVREYSHGPSISAYSTGSRAIATDAEDTVMDEKGGHFTFDPTKRELAVNIKGTRMMFNRFLRFRRRKPNIFQAPGFNYHSDQIFRHRDFAGRVKEKPQSDRYLHAMDGRLRKLIVAASDDVLKTPSSTWRRTYIRTAAPRNVLIATWVIDFKHNPKSWKDWLIMLARSFFANFLLQIAFYIKMHTFFTQERTRWDFEGKYAPIPYVFHGSAKVWSNHLENREKTSLMARNTDVYRVLQPRELCFLRRPEERETYGVDKRLVAEWGAKEGHNQDLSYIFVAYSTEQFNNNDQMDCQALHAICEAAARAAGVRAYWVANSNMDKDDLESDVFRIADVLRGARSLVIAVGRPSNALQTPSTSDMLRQWGSRMWTFPEALLSPGREIKVYTRGTDLSAPLVLSKSQFASRVWDTDAARSRQLIDHFLGNLGLSRLELAVTALDCIYARHTTEYLAGDQAYALMGLLRLRPQIDKTDSPFQAFARLSLANDSDRLLERYLCTMPRRRDQPWYVMDDAYQSALWDIEPYCQVAGICGSAKDAVINRGSDSDTVILDGARGASVRWKSFYPIQWTTGFSWKRWCLVQLMENSTLFFTAATALWALGDHARGAAHEVNTVGRVAGAIGLDSASGYLGHKGTWLTWFANIAQGLGILFFFIYVYTWFATPKLVKATYGGKIKSVQAALFGFEGYVNLPTIERAIFGGSFGRMTWSAAGSPLSRSYTSGDGERYGVDPTHDSTVREIVERAKSAKPGDMRVFTLVDTYNMELTLFEAVHPPTCFFLCASEGGMQRAVGCSYDWTTQTMFRETVLRMPTTTLNRMDRVPRFKIGIQRPEMPSMPAGKSV